MFLTISYIIRSDPIRTAITNQKVIDPRLFCVLIDTHSKHAEFIYLNNVTWAKHCHKIGIVKYEPLSKFGVDDNDSKFIGLMKL